MLYQIYSLIMRVVLVLLVVVLCNTRLSSGDSAMDKIDKSIAAGQAIMNLLADHKVTGFAASLLKIGGKVNKYLEGFSPLLGLFETLLPDDDSQSELIEEGFARMDAKFDQVFNKIDDLGRETEHQSLIAQYGKYAREIEYLSKKLDDYLLSSIPNGTAKQDFLKHHGTTFDENIDQLYNAMMSEESGVLTDSIPEIARKYTSQNRKDVQLIMKRIIHLIIQGTADELAYYSLIEDDENYNKTKQEWEERISKLLDHAREIDEDMQYDYMPQVKKDIASLLAKMEGQSNKDFADTLYNFLSDKYEWREWVVVVFNDIPSDAYKLKLAKNAFQINLHGRNVLVASSSKNRKPDISDVKSKLEKIPSGYRYAEYAWWHRFEGWHYKFYNEEELFDKESKSNIGSDFTIGVMKKRYFSAGYTSSHTPDLVIRGPEDRYTLITKQNLDMEHSDNYLPGEVRFWMFAIYTDTETRPVHARVDPIGDAIEACEGREGTPCEGTPRESTPREGTPREVTRRRLNTVGVIPGDFGKLDKMFNENI